MHEEKVALTKNQIAALRRAAETRSIQDIFVVACGGSLATLYPILYILDRETNAVHVSLYHANILCVAVKYHYTAQIAKIGSV